MPRSKRLLYLGGAALVSTTIAGLVLEVLVRLLAPQPANMAWLAPDAAYGHRMRPNYHQLYPFAGTDFVMEVHTNALGHRDAPSRAKRPGEKTIVFVGDSVTFGHGVNIDDRFDTLLDGMLQEAGLPYRLINTGVNAWGTLQATQYMRDHFEQLEPDILTITFTGNDPSDDAYFREKGQSFDVVRFPGKAFLRSHSHLFRFTTHRIFVLYHSIAVKRGSQDDPGAIIDTQSGALITEAQWASTAGILQSFRDAFLSYNPDGHILIQPAAPWEGAIAAHLETMADELGLVFVDMSAQVRDVPPGELRLSYDPHWSPRMHAIVAESLFHVFQTLDAPKQPIRESETPDSRAL